MTTTFYGVMMLTQNSELREIGVFNWTLPAWVVQLSDGTTFNACPSAGVCAKLCYARNGTYLFPKVRAAHVRNLERVLDDLDGWRAAMTSELRRKRYRATGKPRELTKPDGVQLDPWMHDWYMHGGRAVRVHDAGDFFSDEYLRAWLQVARDIPDVLFYAYTKEVRRFRSIADVEAPPNFRWLFSLGGKEDHLIDRDRDRHADVFPDVAAINAAGYVSQDASDLYAITLATSRVGIPANNIRHFRKRQGSSTFGDLQHDRHAT
jgi:hypothetical protein